MSLGSRKKRKSGVGALAEQLRELSTPLPPSFHPDEEDLACETAARVCDDIEEEEGEGLGRGGLAGEAQRASRLRRVDLEFQDDPRYAGRAVTRRELEGNNNEMLSLGTDEQDVQYESESERSSEMEDRYWAKSSLKEVEEEEEEEEREGRMDDEEASLTKDEESDGRGEMEEGEREGRERSGASMPIISANMLQEDIGKGKAAKQQLSVWDGVMEGRIRFQKVLSLSNRLPRCDSLPAFQLAGGQQLEASLTETRNELRQLMDGLLALEKSLKANKNTSNTPKSKASSLDTAAANSFEEEGAGEAESEVPSEDSVASELDEEVGERDMNGEEKLVGEKSVSMGNQSFWSDHKESGEGGGRRKRKRKYRRNEWVLPGGKRDYESHLSSQHTASRPHRDAVIDKWNNKTRLASGKLSSKSFVQVDGSVTAQIRHVLRDQARLIRRTQLKRSSYSILGEEMKKKKMKKERDNGDSDIGEEGSEGGGGGGGGGGDKSDSDDGESGEVKQGDSAASSLRDAHLRVSDVEVFDDDDFYQQLLRELIERKMNFTESDDPVSMGRQWLELQKLRKKVKRKVDTRASKGRKIRYDIHPKLVDFMAPVHKGTLSDVSRNDLFCSLFGAQLQP